MTKHDLSSEALIAYLLGSLPEAEAEQFDEMSLTDDDFAQQLSVAEKDLLDAYVQRELSTSHLEQFNNYYLASPIRRSRVQLAEALQAFAEAQQSKESPKHSERSIMTSAGAMERGSTWRIKASPRFAWQWGLAVVVVVLISVGVWLLVQRRAAQQPIDQVKVGQSEKPPGESGQQSVATQERKPLSPAPREAVEGGKLKEPEGPRGPAISVATFVLMPQMRGIAGTRKVVLPAGTERVLMQLRLEPNSYSRYSVSLVAANHTEVLWRSGKLSASKSDESPTLNVTFPARLLRQERHYVLQLSGVKPAGGGLEIITNYSFEVVKGQ